MDIHSGWQDNVLVIPCYDEAPGFLHSVLPAEARSLLVIVVVNAPDNAAAQARERTAALLDRLRGPASQPLTMAAYASDRNVQLLIIDRLNQPIPHRQGVGLARKIGADVALALIAANKVAGGWVHATDADVSLPNDYLHTPLPGSGTAAVLFPFRHRASNEEPGDLPMQARADLYELHMRYYVNRLRYAGSPYAFHTLGSTMAIHGDAYAKVRGYPRRNAGEDFYLLNKLAKVASIQPLDAAPITIRARLSRRVPFGTGPALDKIDPSRPQDYLSYSPASFELLRGVLAAIAGVAAGAAWEADAQADAVLAALGFFDALHAAQRQQRNPDTLRKALHQWFDGFRTLRFVHECRRFHPDAPLLGSLASILADDYTDPQLQLHGHLRRLTEIETFHALGVQ